MDKDNMTVFGQDLGDTTTSNRFHLLTSLKLLKLIDEFDNRGFQHVDATYKIIKYCYPLIVLGFTDLNFRFLPVAFLFTKTTA